jgi:hypothetical protein
LASLRGEKFARSVQLWINQVEGFFEERITGLTKKNYRQALNAFRRMAAEGYELKEHGSRLEGNSAVAVRAERVLHSVIAKLPELEQRLRDARVLVALGDQGAGMLNPEDVAWLHWLHNALPTPETLPHTLLEDEEYLRLRAQLRVAQESQPDRWSGTPVPPSFTSVSLHAPTDLSAIPRNKSAE